MQRIREARLEDAAVIARVHVASWRTTYRGLLPDTLLDGLDEARRAEIWRRVLSAEGRQGFVFVAEQDGQVVGLANAGVERTQNPTYPGELYAIYLLREAQGRGLGRQLLLAAAERLLLEGYPAMLVWVLRENTPARRFYEALGGRYLYDQEKEVGFVSVLESAYGWPDLRTLVGG